MVMVIDNSPSAETLRQRALSDPMNQLADSLKDINDWQAQRAATKRQMALEEMKFNMEAAKNGQDLTYDDAKAYAEGNYKPKELTAAKEAVYGEQKEMSGPMQPGQERGLISPLISEAVPATYGNANPYMNLTAAKKAENAAALADKQSEAELRRANINKINAETNDYNQSDVSRTKAGRLARYNTNLDIEKENSKAKTEGGKIAINEHQAAGFSKRARQAEEALSRLPKNYGTGYGYGFQNASIPLLFTDASIGLPERFKTEEAKLFEQSKRNFVSANLRKESGANIPDAEQDNEEKKYFPQDGDTDEVVAQKAQAREQAMLNLESEGRRALPYLRTADNINSFKDKQNTINVSGYKAPGAEIGNKVFTQIQQQLKQAPDQHLNNREAELLAKKKGGR